MVRSTPGSDIHVVSRLFPSKALAFPLSKLLRQIEQMSFPHQCSILIPPPNTSYKRTIFCIDTSLSFSLSTSSPHHQHRPSTNALP
mmetsp:Transcript_32661/g.70483  ORF Transcript_32661/g.70483 Transcript_32661/m.70483 type:complete len:86 (-) Transcript_32661:1357-1614(-)